MYSHWLQNFFWAFFFKWRQFTSIFFWFYSNIIFHIIESQLMVSKVLFESLQLKNDAIFSIKICYRCNQVSSYVCWCDNGCGVSSLTYNIRKIFTTSCMKIQIIIEKNPTKIDFFACITTILLLKHWHIVCVKKSISVAFFFVDLSNV